jgi:P pilus assembly chaperone PapD
MFRVMTGYILSGLVVGAMLVLSGGTAAAGVCSFEVSPLTMEIQIEPGRAYTGTIDVTNTGEEAEHIHVYSQDWTLKPDGVVVFLPAGKTPGSASTWVQLIPSELDLEPGQTQRVRYTIRVPTQAAGEARTAVILEAEPRELSMPGGPSRLVPRIGTIIYVQCGPKDPARVRAVRFDVDRSGGTLAVENLGTSHLRFKGYLEIRDQRGALVRRQDLNPFVVLPAPFNRRSGRLGPEVLSGLPAGRYQITAILDHGGDALLGARIETELGPEPPIQVAGEP